MKCVCGAVERTREIKIERITGGESKRKKPRHRQQRGRMRRGKGNKEEERTIPCAHDGTKMQSPGINEEETRSCWSKFSRRGWE